MPHSTKNIDALEEYIRADVTKSEGEAIALAICEVARQLARLADDYEIANGMSSPDQ